MLKLTLPRPPVLPKDLTPFSVDPRSGKLLRNGSPVNSNQIYLEGKRFWAETIRRHVRGEDQRQPYPISPHADPAVIGLFKIIEEQGAYVKALEREAGLGDGVLQKWRLALHNPKVNMLTWVGQVLGYELVWRKKCDSSE